MRRYFGHLLCAAAVGMSPASAAAQLTHEGDIVIVGRNVAKAEATLAHCRADGCTVDDEIGAALTVADAQFLEGSYPAALDTVNRTWSRVRKHRREAPVRTSDLLRARSRLASVNGRPQMSTLSAADAVSTLRLAMPSDDARVLQLRLEVGTAMARVGRIDAARSQFNDVERDARSSGQPLMAAIARLRAAVLYTALAMNSVTYKVEALQAITALERERDPTFENVRIAATVLRARLAMAEGRVEEYERLLAALPAINAGPDGPMLAYEPRITEAMLQAMSETVLSGATIPPRWADVDFWIDPDGTVRDVSILRSSASGHASWQDIMTKLIQQRRYAPSGLKPGSAGLYRVQRFSLVHDLKMRTGSRIATRETMARLETLDITGAVAANR